MDDGKDGLDIPKVSKQAGPITRKNSFGSAYSPTKISEPADSQAHDHANFDNCSPSFALVCVFLLLALGCAILSAAQEQQSANAPPAQGLKPILSYISSAWDTLTRSMTECQSVVDPKLKTPPVLYLPANFPEPPAVHKLAADCNVQHRASAKGDPTSG